MRLATLKRAGREHPESLIRLGRYLRLKFDETMSMRQLAKLINWRLTRTDIYGEHRFRR